MTEKQEHLLKLFQELDHICQENELRYVLAEESTLAAVGRAGFAGGETEIKVYMPRADWNRLGEIAGKELPKDRILYPEPMAGYGEDFGCALEKQQILGSGPAGERIHIRILDPVSEEPLRNTGGIWGFTWILQIHRRYMERLGGFHHPDITDIIFLADLQGKGMSLENWKSVCRPFERKTAANLQYMWENAFFLWKKRYYFLGEPVISRECRQ